MAAKLLKWFWVITSQCLISGGMYFNFPHYGWCLLRYSLPGFPIVALPFFSLKLKIPYKEIFWDYMNILFFIKFVPLIISFLAELVITSGFLTLSIPSVIDILQWEWAFLSPSTCACCICVLRCGGVTRSPFFFLMNCPLLASGSSFKLSPVTFWYYLIHFAYFLFLGQRDVPKSFCNSIS